ncbi:MAG: glycosyltransferase family 39 protein [Fibrobacterota bacterium]
MPPFREYGAYLFLFLAFLLSRFLFLSHTPYEWDSVSFAFAIRDFSIPSDAPHPPGYLYYVLAGQLADAVFRDPLRSLLALNFIFGALTFGVLYRIGRLLRGRRAGLLAAFLFVVNPFAWFYGEVAEIYLTLGCMSALCGYFFLRYERDGQPGSLYRATLMLGIAGGFRPDALFFLLPLWGYLVFFIHPCRRTAFLQALLLAVLTLAWGVPVLVNCNGLSSYLALSGANVAPFFRDHSVLFGAPVAAHLRMVARLGAWTLLGLGPLLMVIAAALLSGRWRTEHLRDTRLFLLWTVPAFIFFALFYIAKPGYLLFLLPPVILATAACIDRLFRIETHGPWKIIAVLLLLSLPGLFYLFSPGTGGHDADFRVQGGARNALKRLFRYTLSDLRAMDALNETHRLLVSRALLDHPETILVFAEPSHWSFRAANYYFPETEAHLFFDVSGVPFAGHEQYEYGRNYTVQGLSVQTEQRPVLFFTLEHTPAAAMLNGLGLDRVDVLDAYAYWLAGDNVRTVDFCNRRISLLPLNTP